VSGLGSRSAGPRLADGAADEPVRRRAFLSLGSNLGDRWGWLRGAVAALPDVTAVSPVYETAPVGGPPQGPFLNLVVRLDTALSPMALLTTCRQLERAADRRRTVRFGPRTLDVDIVWIDGVRIDTPELTVPHPRLWERRFVVAPLADLAPDLATPEAVAAAGGAVRRVGTLDEVDPIT
jgi:2-amino-4-hydroxy-6-hydroxymethyldihydropteridine diphosphokinase